MSAFRVLGRISSINVRKVLWTCGEIGIEYAREDWGLGFSSTKQPEFLALNPNGLVPVVESEDGVLWESNTICRYLASKHDRGDLLPVSPWRRALVERWMDWQATDLNSAWRGAFLGLVRKDAAYVEPAIIAASTREWNSKMEILERQLSVGVAFVAGEEFTVADVVVGLSVNRWLGTPIERPDLPAVAAYFGRLKERPAFRRGNFDTLP
ncbi:glutathione S-transferase [Rhizobium sp. BK491]|uniref:glutathione S-transferase family protein n=1 Tax=Rhizobium sp. BK491 TaxID=2587009 RepID=UPI00161E9B31|nr:glutathione S-transferase [Rhizobium sp. BK491]MBB3571803.1 glutathione S-transferase [Rhizobium sp. BK491]